MHLDPMQHPLLSVSTAVVISFLPAMVRGYNGVPAFGDTHASKLTCACVFLGSWAYIMLMVGFHRLAVHSYRRRAKAITLLDELCGDGVEKAVKKPPTCRNRTSSSRRPTHCVNVICGRPVL